MISRELEAEILRLHHAERWPIGTLARQLHVHHTTVRRVLRQAGIAIVRERPRPSMIYPYALSDMTTNPYGSEETERANHPYSNPAIEVIELYGRLRQLRRALADTRAAMRSWWPRAVPPFRFLFRR